MYYYSKSPEPLTADDIKNLRDATKIVFEHLKPSRNESGMGRLRYDLEVKRGKRVATLEDQPLTVGTTIESWRKYQEGVENDPGTDVDYLGDDISCFDMIHSPHQSEVWRTVLAIVRPGDRLWICWRRGNSNGYLEKSSPRLHLDECYVQLERPQGRVIPPGNGDTEERRTKAPLRLKFQMRASVCEANTARLVRTRTEMCGW